MINDDSEEPRIAKHADEGLLRPILGNLEDFRWVLVKTVVSLLVAMVVCLPASNWLVKAFQWPLVRASLKAIGTNQVAFLELGDQVLDFKPTNSPVWLEFLGTNQFTRVHVVLSLTTTNTGILRLERDPVPLKHPPLRSILPIKSYTPVEPFMVAIKMAIYAGLLFALPYIFYTWLNFLTPLFGRTGRRFVFAGLVISPALFYTGAAFCYFFLTDIALAASVNFAGWMNLVANEWRATDYISFLSLFMLGMGICFQLPVLILILVYVGILDYKKLARFRMYWVVINLVISAVLTPPDVITQVMMAGAMQVFYELSLVIAWFWARKEQRLADAPTPDP